MINVYESSRDSIEVKFNSSKDMIKWISDEDRLSELSDNTDLYLRIVNNTVTTSISIGISRFMPKDKLFVTITSGKNTNGPEYFDNYKDAFNWIKKIFK